ncbi:MAG: hypothetical protein M3214_09815, partial [Actinomycetota bacterium]|nr:hypothetical protein [Actinomycetota bacterium]
DACQTRIRSLGREAPHSPEKRRRTDMLLATSVAAVAGILSAAAVALLTSASADAEWRGKGFYRVKTANEHSYHAVGYGPGWVMSSYKLNGPMVGYLFAKGFRLQRRRS